MTGGEDRFAKAVAGCCEAIVDHADELTDLDRAIGDADHGINMRRGAEAVRERLAELESMEPDRALVEIGKTLVMKVGGASGPLFGTLAMSFGKALAESGGSPAGAAAAFAVAVEAVAKRGKSHRGQKTLLDVLYPVTEGFSSSPEDFGSLPGVAESSAQATVPMQAERGRASFLGERSVGHMDPGSRSVALLVAAAVEAYRSDG